MTPTYLLICGRPTSAALRRGFSPVLATVLVVIVVVAAGVLPPATSGSAQTAAISEFAISLAGTPRGIAAGPDGALWFTESDAHRIGRITTAGAISEFSLPTATGSIESIAAG